MKIAILALQGAFAEHEQMLRLLGVETTLIREHWEDASGLIIPGGESTSMMRIMRDEGLFEPIRQAILDGLPVLGTCAGLIMLDRNHLGVMDIKARRNAYGRQLGSFQILHNIKGMGKVPMVFIRAPYVERVGNKVEVLSTLDNHVVAVRQDNMLACSFHPELTEDTRVHQYWLETISGKH